MPQDEALRTAATAVAARLRSAGRRVDLVLEPKRLKWAFKQAERCNAGRFVCGYSSAAPQQHTRAVWRGASRHGRAPWASRHGARRLGPACACWHPLPQRLALSVIPSPPSPSHASSPRLLALQRGWCWWRLTSGRAALCASRTLRRVRRPMCHWRSSAEGCDVVARALARQRRAHSLARGRVWGASGGTACPGAGRACGPRAAVPAAAPVVRPASCLSRLSRTPQLECCQFHPLPL